jgi:hypothetical protein
LSAFFRFDASAFADYAEIAESTGRAWTVTLESVRATQRVSLPRTAGPIN